MGRLFRHVEFFPRGIWASPPHCRATESRSGLSNPLFFLDIDFLISNLYGENNFLDTQFLRCYFFVISAHFGIVFPLLKSTRVNNSSIRPRKGWKRSRCIALQGSAIVAVYSRAFRYVASCLQSSGYRGNLLSFCTEELYVNKWRIIVDKEKYSCNTLGYTH